MSKGVGLNRIPKPVLSNKISLKWAEQVLAVNFEPNKESTSRTSSYNLETIMFHKIFKKRSLYVPANYH